MALRAAVFEGGTAHRRFKLRPLQQPQPAEVADTHRNLRCPHTLHCGSRMGATGTVPEGAPSSEWIERLGIPRIPAF